MPYVYGSIKNLYVLKSFNKFYLKEGLWVESSADICAKKFSEFFLTPYLIKLKKVSSLEAGPLRGGVKGLATKERVLFYTFVLNICQNPISFFFSNLKIGRMI